MASTQPVAGSHVSTPLHASSPVPCQHCTINAGPLAVPHDYRHRYRHLPSSHTNGAALIARLSGFTPLQVVNARTHSNAGRLRHYRKRSGAAGCYPSCTQRRSHRRYNTYHRRSQYRSYTRDCITGAGSLIACLTSCTGIARTILHAPAYAGLCAVTVHTIIAVTGIYAPVFC